MHTITIDGFTYAAENLAARAEAVSMQAASRTARAAGRDASAAGFLLGDIRIVVEDQLDGIHRVTRGACSCGLVVEQARTLPGHLDLRTLEPACTFVVADHEGYAGFACQACRMVWPGRDVPSARRAVEEHECAWVL